MAASPNPIPSNLELSLQTTHPSSSGDDHMVKDLDLNQTPETEEEEEDQDVEKEDRNSERRAKKLRLTKEQSYFLEESFGQNHILTIKKKRELSTLLNLTPRQVEVWFQNRRARNKLKHTEMECEYLRRCFGSLTEQNRRLQLEIEELRSLNSKNVTAQSSDSTRSGLGSGLGTGLRTGLTMCSRCERVMAAAIEERSALSSQSQSRKTISSSSSHS